MDCLGPLPDHMLLAGSKSRKYFNVDGLSYTLKSDAQYARETNTPPRKPNRRYFEFASLEELTRRYPSSSSSSADADTRASLAHLLKGLLQMDPMERWTPQQAARHPFLTGEPFDPSWQPPRRPLG